MATKYKEETVVVEEKITLTDWLLDLPIKIFFWGCMAIMFILWLIAMAVVIIYTKLVMH
ncbi:MAG: hypothetical protein ACO294_05340 [Methylococcales bacterium]